MAFQLGAALAVFLAAGASPADSTAIQATNQQATNQQVSVPLIEPATLKTMIAANTKFVLVDVRRPDEFVAGHIDGAMLMPLDTLATSYSKLSKDTTLVVYCRSGHRSAKAVQFLQSHNYGKAVSLNGGYLAWTAQAH